MHLIHTCEGAASRQIPSYKKIDTANQTITRISEFLSVFPHNKVKMIYNFVLYYGFVLVEKPVTDKFDNDIDIIL